VNRSKQAKKEAKQRERDEAVAKRKAAGLDPEPGTEAESDASKPPRN
jgi:hypothetical protein